LSSSELDINCNILKSFWEEFDFDLGDKDLDDLLEIFDFETILGIYFAIGYLNGLCELNSTGVEIIDKSKKSIVEYWKNEDKDFDESNYLDV